MRVISGYVQVSAQQLRWIREQDEAIARHYRVPYWLVGNYARPSWRRRPIWRLRAIVWGFRRYG